MTPFDQPPEQNMMPHATILVVGAKCSKKVELAQELCGDPDAPAGDLVLSIRVAESLSPPKIARPKIHFVVFLVDLTSRQSWLDFKTMLESGLHHDYLGGRCALVLSKAGSPSAATMPEEIEELAYDYDMPSLYSELEAGDDLAILKGRIMQLVKIASNQIKAINPAVVLSVNFELCHNSSIE